MVTGKKRTASLDVRYEKKPTVTPPYPMPMGTERKVKDGDTWRSIAKAEGIPVWELIKFNCRSTDPREVNWWLKNVLGCDTCTLDEKNWMFSSASKSIYLPPPSSLKMPSDALAETVELSIFDGKVKIGVLTLEGLCSRDASPLNRGKARYTEIVPIAGNLRFTRGMYRTHGWNTGTPPEGMIPFASFGYNLDTAFGPNGGVLMGLDYPPYAKKVQGTKGSLILITNQEVSNMDEIKSAEREESFYEIIKNDPNLNKIISKPRKVKTRYNYSYAHYTWEAKVTSWAASPPPGFVLPD